MCYSIAMNPENDIFTNQWMKGKMCHLDWALVEYRYVMNNTMKLSHNLQSLNCMEANGEAVLSLFCCLLIMCYDSQVWQSSGRWLRTWKQFRSGICSISTEW